MYTGPKLTNDNLVFGYDTGYGIADNTTATRFYPGEQTVNYTTDTPSQGGWTGSYSVIDSSLKTFRLNVSNFSANPGAGWRSFTWDLRAYTGQSVTISATVEVPSASPGTFAWVMMGQGNTHTNSSGAGGYMGYSAASERVYKSTTTKERITWSGTLGNSGTASQPSGHVGFTVWYNNGVPGTNSYVEVSDVQIELKSHETPFVNGTRSDTASLIDLKKTTDIDVGDVSFDSTGQPTFDGTDDVINLDSHASIIPVGGPITIESVVRWDDLTPNGVIVSFGGNGTGSGFLFQNEFTQGLEFVLFDGNGNSGRAKILANNSTQYLDKYIHMVGTYDGSTILLYINGVQAATASYTNGYPAQSYFRIGGEYNRSYFANIDLGVLKIYNKTLSATEIADNFNAYKNRFDIQ
jgi:hypothetical protein